MAPRPVQWLVAIMITLALLSVAASTAGSVDDRHADVCFEVAPDRLPEEVWD